MLLLLIFLIAHARAFRSLPIQASKTLLYQQILTYLDLDNKLFQFNLSDNNKVPLQEHVTDFDQFQDIIYSWNQSLLSCLDPEGPSSLEISEFSNISLVGRSVFALNENNQTFKLTPPFSSNELLEQRIIPNCSTTNHTLLALRDNLTQVYVYVQADHKFHKVDMLFDQCSDVSVWLREQAAQSRFDATIWSNGTATFMGNSLPYKMLNSQLYWHHESSQLHLKHLISIQEHHIYAIYSSNAICVQQYVASKLPYYQNMVCLRIELDYQLESLNFYQQRLQLVLKHKANQTILLDRYEQCMFAALDMEDREDFFCTIGTESEQNCHHKTATHCFNTMQFRLGGHKGIVFLVLLAMMVALIIQLLKCLAELLTILAIVFREVGKFLCCFIPLKIRSLGRRIYFRYKRQFGLPIKDLPQCPICLDFVEDPIYFSCKRHCACAECYRQYENVSLRTKIVCPFRD